MLYTCLFEILKLFLLGLCVEKLSINTKKIIVMVAINLYNIHKVCASISSFVATIAPNPIQHKGKGEKKSNYNIALVRYSNLAGTKGFLCQNCKLAKN
jgi:hypothetical protein